MNEQQRSFLGVSYFVHPLPLLAVAVLLLNDHWLKAHHPSWVTGKLSDFAGMFFFPLFLCALVSVVRNLFAEGGRFYWIGPRLLLAAVLVTDAVFVAIKLYAPAAAVFVSGLRGLGFASAQVVRDPTDLIALLSSVLVFYFARGFWSPER